LAGPLRSSSTNHGSASRSSNNLSRNEHQTTADIGSASRSSNNLFRNDQQSSVDYGSASRSSNNLSRNDQQSSVDYGSASRSSNNLSRNDQQSSVDYGSASHSSHMESLNRSQSSDYATACNSSRSSMSDIDCTLDDLVDYGAAIVDSRRMNEDTRDGGRIIRPPSALKRKSSESDGHQIKRKDVFHDNPPSDSDSSDDDDVDDSKKMILKGPSPGAKRVPEKAKQGKAGGKVHKVDTNDTVTNLLSELVNNQRALMKKKTPTDTAISLFKTEHCEGLTPEDQMSFIVTLASSATDVNIFLAFNTEQRNIFIKSKTSAA
jgi:hypothetical protein